MKTISKNIHPSSSFISGVDISSLQHSLDLGAKYFHPDGAPGDPLQILRENGVNYARLRVWVDPVNGYCSPSRIVEFAPRIKGCGMKLLVDFHYSDTWADPLHQERPAAWGGHRFNRLQKDLADHTYSVCASLASAGAPPDMVQIGNEITPGLLLPEGSTGDWEKLAALLNQGYQAVKSFRSETEVMLHIDRGGDKDAARSWFDQAAAHGVNWDVIGLSYYTYWHGPIHSMRDTVREMAARYRKPVVIVETAYPFTLAENDHEKNAIHSADQLSPDYPPTPEGQASNLRAVLKAAHSGGAAGVFYWEPTWTAVEGNGWDPANPGSGNQWENQALFDFHGRALPALSEFHL